MLATILETVYFLTTSHEELHHNVDENVKHLKQLVNFMIPFI